MYKIFLFFFILRTSTIHARTGNGGRGAAGSSPSSSFLSWSDDGENENYDQHLFKHTHRRADLKEFMSSWENLHLKQQPPPQFKETNLNDETLVLVDFYNQLRGREWDVRTNWVTRADTCTWHGVTCNSQGSVTMLQLPENNLRGRLLSGSLSLPNLNHLDLSDNAITELPADIPGEINLVKLNNNQLSSLPPQLLTTATRKSNLEVGYNPLHGNIPWPSDDMMIHVLDFSRTGLTELHPSLYQSFGVSLLNIEHNHITDLPVFPQCNLIFFVANHNFFQNASGQLS